jgi:uncharacterized protein (TIGR03435 family)
LKDLIKVAFAVHARQIEGGPDWMDTGRFDIVARPEGSPNTEQGRMMIRKLVGERFNLTHHPPIIGLHFIKFHSEKWNLILTPLK